MPRDRSKPWGRPQQEEEPTEPTPVDDEPTEPPSEGRRAVRSGTRVNLDETNVGGSLLPGGFGDLANPFEQAVAPSFVDEQPTEPPDTFAPPPEPPEPSLELTEPRFTPPPLPTELGSEADDGLGPVEEFTISGLMPDELAAMTAAARKAVAEQEQARSRARPRRDDPDPGITGVAGFGSFAPPPTPPPAPDHDDEESVDDEETVAAQLSPELLRKLGRPAAAPKRDYNTFGAGLQRLDELPSVDEAPPHEENSVGGILELLDGTDPLKLPGEAAPSAAPPAPEPPAPTDEGRDRPRRVRTNRAGSRSTAPEADSSSLSRGRGRAPSASPSRNRVAAPPSRGATPRPAPPRSKPPLQRSDSRTARPRPTPPLPVDTASSANTRAADEEARFRAALAAAGDEEHTSWVSFDGAPAPAPPPSAEPTQPTPAPSSSGLPGVEPTAPLPSRRDPEPSLTMHLEDTGEKAPVGAPGVVPHDETTVRRAQRSIGDEETIPARDIPSAASLLADEETRPVPVPPNRPADPEPAPPPAPEAKASPGRAQRVPSKKPPPKKPGKGKASAAPKGKKKAPVAISALDDSSDTYRDPMIAWLLSIFTVFFLGAMLIAFLILLLYLI